ncbi:glycine receptor subunit alpha-4-like [Pollicipes pollicipes]|nr:glycine receptor subunit alpha-4-like [Pollicipes pollicipes]
MTWAEHLPLTYSTSTLSQFSYHLHRSNDGAEKGVFHTSSKSVYERSQIHMYVVLTRKIMFYMMQIYIPSMLFVVVSWISFLIPAEMAQGRMLLTITTMLTMVSLFAAGSEYVPKASYVKAIDVWMCLCTFLSFFAVVDCLADVRLESMLSGESRRKATDTFVLTGQARRQTVVEIFMKYARAGGAPAQGEDPGERDEQIASANTLTEMLVKWFFKAHRASVIVYPVVFILFNIVYWVVCLGTLEELDLGARGVPV